MFPSLAQPCRRTEGFVNVLWSVGTQQSYLLRVYLNTSSTIGFVVAGASTKSHHVLHGVMQSAAETVFSALFLSFNKPCRRKGCTVINLSSLETPLPYLSSPNTDISYSKCFDAFVDSTKKQVFLQAKEANE